MGSFQMTKTLACLLLFLVKAFESSGLEGQSPTVTIPVRHYEGGATVEGVETGGRGECSYHPRIIIQPPTCNSAAEKTPKTSDCSDVQRVISTELQEVKQKLDEVVALLSPRVSNSSSVVPDVEPKCTTPKLSEGLTSSNCSAGVQVHAGTWCRYHCADGVTMQGDQTVSCGSDGNWGKPLPKCRVTLQRDCSDAVDRGFTKSGIFLVQPTDNGEPIEVFCDMETDYGGWTVFQRRQDGSVNFYRLYETYEAGFGELDGEFWLGLENLNRLTTQTNFELRVDLEDFDGETAYAVYKSFSIGNRVSKYTLSVSDYTGTAGDSLIYHDGQPFTTKNKDNDDSQSNCAFTYHGAWWYKSCLNSNLNGWYLGPGGNQEAGKGVTWYAWRSSRFSLKKADMKFRFTG